MKVFLSFSFHFTFVYFCRRVHTVGMHVLQHGCGDASTTGSSVGPEDWTQVARIAQQCLYQPAHLTGPLCGYFFKKLTERLLCNTEIRVGVFERKLKYCFVL